MNFPRKLTENLGMKMLALLMAIVIYYAIRDAVNTSGYRGPQPFIQPQNRILPAMANANEETDGESLVAKLLKPIIAPAETNATASATAAEPKTEPPKGAGNVQN